MAGYKDKIKRTDLGFTLGYNDFMGLSIDERDKFILEFVYQSNLIEGIRDYPYGNTVMLGEPNPTFVTIDDHMDALGYVLDNKDRLPLRSDIREIHRRLMNGLLPEHQAGNYRQTDVYIVGDGRVISSGVVPKHVPECLANLEDKIYSCQSNWKEVWGVHNEFESIHPFVDGNGRTGRLLLNWLALNRMERFNLVDASKRMIYYERIQNYRKEFASKIGEIKFSSVEKANERLNEIRMERKERRWLMEMLLLAEGYDLENR